MSLNLVRDCPRYLKKVVNFFVSFLTYQRDISAAICFPIPAMSVNFNRDIPEVF